MAKSSQILETVLSIVDRASDGIKRVEKDARSLESLDPTINLDADDNASDDIRGVGDLADKWDGRTAQAKLKVEQREAKRDLRVFERQLQDVDSAEAEAKVLADIQTAEKRLKDIDDQLDRLDRKKVEPEVDTGDLEAQGSDAGGMFGGGFAGGLGKAGVVGAIAAALTSAFNTGIERIQIQARFRSQFGLVKADAERLGKEAADVYADGWGESLAEVQTALGLIQQQLVNTNVVAQAETDEIGEAALAMASVFGVDVAEIIRSTGQLLKNGLAPDAEAALDIMTEGFQGGANTAGDFLETIDEYSQHFAAFGLSGKDATDIIIAGFQGGQRDADKLADAVKEMRIRTVEDSDAVSDAYAELGISADEYRERILEGGDSARTAFREIIAELQAVEDPVRQNALAVELIGTQYEDLGPTALDALGAITEGTVKATGATEDLVEVQGEATSEISKLWREATDVVGGYLETGAGAVNDYVAGIRDADFAEFTSGLEAIQGKEFGNLLEAREFIDDLGLSADAADKVLRMYAGANDLVVTSTSALSSELVQASIEEGIAKQRREDLARSTDALTEATDDAGTEARDHAAAMDEQRRKAEALAGQLADLVGGALGVEQAQIRAADAADGYRAKIDELNESGMVGEELERAKRSAFIEATEAQVRAAQSAADYEAAQREANGEVLTAHDRNAILAEQLRTVAGTLAPGSDLRQQLWGYANELDQIPRTIETELTAKPLWDTLNGWTAAIRNIPAAKVTAFSAQGGSGTRVFGAEGGIVNRPTLATIGEAGPEAVIPLDRVPGNSPLPSGLGSGSGNAYTINVNAGIGANGADVGRQIVDAIKRYERSNGSRWRAS